MSDVGFMADEMIIAGRNYTGESIDVTYIIMLRQSIDCISGDVGLSAQLLALTVSYSIDRSASVHTPSEQHHGYCSV